ncbi:MAG TPA: gliding motility-associated C-terminal domain-containing protein [Saprospiraceae bacterium]|nr:gliding motility-associated C-terminal domain-containing protein [Saprospiraceae bacterium]
MSIFSAPNTQMIKVQGFPPVLILLLVFCLLHADVHAQPFVVNGSASELSGNCYLLTADQGGLAGSMFSQNSINLSQPFSFSAVLHFGCKDANGADGIVFILATSNTALGGSGGYIGYEGITPSIAVEYDDYQNGWGDPASDHMAVISNGSVDHNAPTNLVGPFDITEVEDCVDHCFSFDWNPVTQTFTAILDTEVIIYTGDIINTIFNANPNVYYGFSAGTGSLSNIHRVCVGPPELVPMEDVTICEGETVQLEADENGFAWTWEFDPTLSDLNIRDPLATPIQNTFYIVSIDYSCGGFAQDTVEVVLTPAPNSIASNNGPLCAGETLNLTASGGSEYEWTGPVGFFSTSQNPVIEDVSESESGLYSVTVTDAAGCTSVANTEVVVWIPDDVEIESVSVPVCEAAEPIQLEGIPAQGMWSGEVGPTGLFDPVSVGVGLHEVFYTITDINGCLNTAQITIEVVPNTPALIIPDGPFCVTDPVQTLSATPAGGTWGEAADNNGQIYPALLGVGTHQVSYMLTDQNGCFDAEIYIEILAAPEIEIIDPGPFCPNLPVQVLMADPPGGTWGGAAAPDGQVNPAGLGPGTYDVFYSYQELNGCGDTDTLQITILPAAPQVTGLTLQCDSLASGYVVTFEILGGDETTYSVVGVPGGVLISGTPYFYMSDTIPTGGSYSFSVDDENHCNPITIAGSYSCFCATNAGLMDLNLIQACAGDTIITTPAEGTLLDPNDSLIYILHLGNSNTLDSIIMISNNGQFPFNAMLQTGVTYYISSVVGNATLPLGVDLSDPCLSVAIGTPVIWSPLPSGFLIAPDVICSMDSLQIVFSLMGNGSFDIIYSDGVQLYPFDDISNGHSITIAPTETASYSLLFIQDQNGSGCARILDTSVTVAVIVPSRLQHSIAICQGDSVYAGGGMQGVGGIFYDTLVAASGCDSIVETTLSVNPLSTTFVNLTSCDSAQAGTFMTSYPDQNGCDSTVITTIIFAASDTSYSTATTCDASQAGIFNYQYMTQEGCDSVVVVTVQLLPHDTTSIFLLSCDSSAVGVIVENLVNRYGCDSTVMETTTLVPTDTTALTTTTCDSAASGVFTDIFQNTYGCDSLVIETIALAPSWLLMEADVTCEPANAGVFTWTYMTQSGCDSIVIETVELLQSDTLIDVSSTCEVSDTGTIIIYLENRFGCDSIIIRVSHLAPEDTCKEIEPIHEIFVPNVFSPNDDGVNDELYIYANPVSVSRIHLFRLYDRWGELIAERHDFLPNSPVYGWDGTLSGKRLQPGVFVWTAEVEYSDGLTELLIGDITLVR